jgi:hypothetical protein
MARIGISEASKITGKSVPTLYRYVQNGKLSKKSDGKFDTNELLRVFGEFKNSEIDNHIDKFDNHELLKLQSDNQMLQEIIADLKNDKRILQNDKENLQQTINHYQRLLPVLPAIPEDTNVAVKYDNQSSNNLFQKFLKKMVIFNFIQESG